MELKAASFAKMGAHRDQETDSSGHLKDCKFLDFCVTGGALKHENKMRDET